MLFAPQSKMNDLNESTREVSAIIGRNVPDFDEYVTEHQKYKQISLTIDNQKVNENYRRGFDILPMWAHYADKGNGVCLVLKKSIIDKGCKANNRIFCKPIIYEKDYQPTINYKSGHPEQELKDRRDSLFFKKSKEWEYEQEYRIIKKTEDPCDGIDISRAIVAVLYANLATTKSEPPYNTPNYETLKAAVGRIPLLYYQIAGVLTDTPTISKLTDNGLFPIWPEIEDSIFDYTNKDYEISLDDV